MHGSRGLRGACESSGAETEVRNSPIEVRLLGPIEVWLDGTRVSLPPSRKARALLAYLIATERAHRREHLCELLWELPDNPRALLRWSLSHLRKLVNADGVERLRTDRNQAVFVPMQVDVDLFAVRRGATWEIDPPEAAALVGRFRGDFIEGLDLPDHLAFSSWRAALRDECRTHLCTLLARALEGEDAPESLVGYARRLVELRPCDASAHATLIRLLGRAGCMAEAEERFRAAGRLLSSSTSYLVITEAWRLARDGAEGTPPPGPAFAANPARDTSPNGLPAVAVLPFSNTSGDPGQDHLADALAEEIIAGLARTAVFPVIARNSSFAFKGRALDVREVAERLGARYVVEGSVRPAGHRVRVTTQLIDASNGRHLWVGRYHRTLDDLLSVQDEIGQRICEDLGPQLLGAEKRRIESDRRTVSNSPSGTRRHVGCA